MATSTDDELAGTEQPFVAHLIELRDRLVRSLIAIAVVFAVLSYFPGPAALYDLLAKPLVAQLPAAHLDEGGGPLGPAPALQERKRRDEAGLGDTRLQLDPQGDRIARGGGGEIGGQVQAERGHRRLPGILSIFAGNWNKTLGRTLPLPREP